MFSINFSEGTKTLRYKIFLKNGKTIQYSSTLKIDASGENSRTESIAPCFTPPALDSAKGRANIEASIPFAPYDNARPYDSQKGKGEVAYFFRYKENGVDVNACTPSLSNLKRPIIIVDGFDPEDGRDIENIYNSRLRYANNQNLGEELRNMGYDVVILNFPRHQVATLNILGLSIPVYQDHGSDYIERNAFVLVKLIQQINAQLQANGSTEQLVVVGPSMGGLISRYALAYMEKHNIPHNTRLWVSFDSPHNGANIPMGVQMFLKHNAEVENDATAQNTLQVQLNNPAAKQMLLQHYQGYNGGINSPAPIFRYNFINNLQNNGLFGSEGFPMKTRRVALINGSKTGILQGASGQLACYFWIPIYIVGIEVRPFESKIFLSGSNANNTLVFWQKKNKPFGCCNYTSNYYSTSPSNTVGYDIAPGGYYNAFEIVFNQFPSKIEGYDVHKQLYLSNHCFIPTKSALAFKGSNKDLGESIADRNLVCSGETPFEAYYAPDENQDHATLHQEGVTWFLQQISPPNKIILCKNSKTLTLTTCPSSTSGVVVKKSFNISAGVYNNGSVNVSGISTGEGFVEFWKDNTRLQRYDILVVAPSVSDISGPASVCSGAATFTLNNIPAGVGVTWATSPNLSPTSGSGTVATVSAVGSGEAWIEYTISDCGQKIRRYINTLNYVQLEGSKYICAGANNLYSVDNFEGATYTWQSSPNVSLTQIAPNVVSANRISDGSGFVRVTINVNNACHSQTRTLNKSIWVGLPTAPVVTQPAGSTPIAPNTYSFTYQKLNLPNVPSTHTIRFASAGAERIVYTVDNLPIPPSNGNLPDGWGVLTSPNYNTLTIDTRRMEIGTYTYTIMGQNDCNDNPFADTAPKTTVIVNIVGLDPLRSMQSQVQIYPNPTENILNLEFAEKQEQAVRYELYNPYSQRVESGSFTEKCSIDVSKLPKNVYFLHLYYPDGSNEKRQIVVQK